MVLHFSVQVLFHFGVSAFQRRDKSGPGVVGTPGPALTAEVNGHSRLHDRLRVSLAVSSSPATGKPSVVPWFERASLRLGSKQVGVGGLQFLCLSNSAAASLLAI